MNKELIRKLANMAAAHPSYNADFAGKLKSELAGLDAAPQVDGVPTDKQIDAAAFALGIQGYAYVDDPAGYRTLVRQFAAAPRPAQAQGDRKPIYYMRDNHTFRELPENVEASLRDIEEELDAGFTSGGLFTKRKGSTDLPFRYTTPRHIMLEQAREWLTKELATRTAAHPQPAAQEQEKDADFLNDLRWRINDVQEMLASGYTTDEWSVPVVNLKTAIKRIDAAISAQSAGEKGE